MAAQTRGLVLMIDFAPMRRTWSLGFVLVTLISGCGGGGGSNQQSARDVAQAYVNARNQGDAAKVCELYSEQLIQSLKTSNCVAFVQEQTSGTATDLSLVGVSQHGDQATATIQARLGGASRTRSRRSSSSSRARTGSGRSRGWEARETRLRHEVAAVAAAQSGLILDDWTNDRVHLE
jgi:ketosteroid isomerase-like protein